MRVTEKIVGAVDRGLCARAARHLWAALRNVDVAQGTVLGHMLRRNRNTWVGSRYGFGRIRSTSAFRAAVPLHTYADLREQIQRISAGERNILTRDDVTFLQLTSGSATGHTKLIPSTARYQRAVQRAVLASRGFFQRWQAQTLLNSSRRGIVLVSTAPVGVTEGGIPFGPASAGHVREAAPFWKFVSVVPYEATRVTDACARRYVHWRYALNFEKLSFVSSPFPSSLLTFAATLLQRSEQLIRDVADGTLTNSIPLPVRQRRLLAGPLRRAPTRARVLERIAAKNGGLSPTLVWPDLGCLNVAHGPTLAAYTSQLAERYGQCPIWGTQYGSAEGIVGVPWEHDSYLHIPAVTSSFLEFIPVGARASPSPATHLVGELATGHRYEVVLTGHNGMYRYRQNDIVEACGEIVPGLPALQLVSRGGGVLSVVWEKTTEGQAAAAVTRWAQEIRMAFADFVVDIDSTVAPARYRLTIEPSGGSANMPGHEGSLDRHLGYANPVYALLRGNGEIGPPTVRFLRCGTFSRFVERKAQEGGASEQVKILHSTTDPRYMKWLEESQAPGSGYQ